MSPRFFNPVLFKKMINVIRDEEKRRDEQREGMDSDIYYDQWLFEDQPFLNRLCLMLLVTLRHEIERELVGIVARSNENGQEISAKNWRKKIWDAQHRKKKNGEIKPKFFNWDDIEKNLHLGNCSKYVFIKPLIPLSNIFKHNIPIEPDKMLLESLNMDEKLNYCEIFESQAFLEGLATFLGLEKGADYFQVAERFIDIASDFIKEVEEQNKLSNVKGEPVRLDSFCE